MSTVVESLPGLPLRDVVLMPAEVRALFIGRRKSIAALDYAVEHKLDIVLVAQQSIAMDAPQQDQLHKTGTVARILQVLKLPDKTRKVLVQGMSRVTISKFYHNEAFYHFEVKSIDVQFIDEVENASLVRIMWEMFEKYVKVSELISSEILNSLRVIEQANELSDAIAMHLSLSLEDKQSMLDISDPKARAEKLVVFIARELEWQKVEKNINARVRKEIERDQESYFHEKRLKAIQSELGDKVSLGSELDVLEKQIMQLPLPEAAREKVDSEFAKLKNMPLMSPESSVIRNYLTWVIDLPWGKYTDLKYDLSSAKRVLDEDHYGLEKVKDRILESLAVQMRVKSITGSILCFVGPPGVGKTSLGYSIARAMGRKFVRIALGGIRDEAEIRGHRKTYVGAMPGRIVKALKRSGVANPLILLDEVDKIGMDFRGDPASALLEVLDPEQNNTFNDHYIELDFDLSKVMFITTANSHDIPDALLDRMEVIELSGYTENEKFAISKNYLVPKCLKEVGLTNKHIRFSKTAILDVIRYYTREAGVRELERMIAKISRKWVREIEESSESKEELASCVRITKQNLEKYLGVKKYEFESANKKALVGLVRGLAWTRVGGDLLTIEASLFPGQGKMVYTGSLGDVMQESIQAASTVVRSLGVGMKLPHDYFEGVDIHIHVPEGATPKDGPSAGITMCTALISAITETPVRADVAMTGEITLRGQLLAVGGLKEKLLAALRGGIKTVIIPKENKQDLTELPDEIKESLEIHIFDHIEEVLQLALVENYKGKKVKTIKVKKKSKKEKSSSGE